MEFQYKGLSAELEKLCVTEEEIDRNVERLKGQELPDMSAEELRENVAAALQAHYDERAEEELLDKLIRQAAQTLDFTPDEDALDEAAQAQMELLKNQLAQRELSLEAYCEFMSTSEEQLLEDMRMDSVQLLRVQEAIDRIAALENISVSEDELGEASEEICYRNQLKLDELNDQEQENFREMVRASLIQRKVLLFVREHAKITIR